MNKLWINRSQCKHHVRVSYDAKTLRKHKHLAHFEAWDLDASNCFGVVRLNPRTVRLSQVVHELVHVAIHFVVHYTDQKQLRQKSVEDQHMYFQEATACIVENLLKQYLRQELRNNAFKEQRI